MYFGLNFPTSVWGFCYVISVTTLDKIVWPGLFGSGIQLTYVLEHDVVIALASDVRVTGPFTVEWAWPGLDSHIGVSFEHHLINGVTVCTTMLSNTFVEHQKTYKQNENRLTSHWCWRLALSYLGLLQLRLNQNAISCRSKREAYQTDKFCFQLYEYFPKIFKIYLSEHVCTVVNLA